MCKTSVENARGQRARGPQIKAVKTVSNVKIVLYYQHNLKDAARV